MPNGTSTRTFKIARTDELLQWSQLAQKNQWTHIKDDIAARIDPGGLHLLAQAKLVTDETGERYECMFIAKLADTDRPEHLILSIHPGTYEKMREFDADASRNQIINQLEKDLAHE